MVTALLAIVFAVLAIVVLRASEKNKREAIRVPLYIENLRARRRRR